MSDPKHVAADALPAEERRPNASRLVTPEGAPFVSAMRGGLIH